MRIYWCMSSQNVPCCNIHTYKVWQRKTLSCHVWLYCCAYLPFSLQNIQKWGVARLLHSLTDHVPNLTVKYSHPTSFRVFFCFILLCMIIMVFIVTHLIGRLLLMLSFFLSFFFYQKQIIFFFVFVFVPVSRNDYIPAIASKPKIPRSPDTATNQNSAHRGRGLALAPQFSQSEPQQSSRPVSASSTGGGGNGSKRMLRAGNQHQSGRFWPHLVTSSTLPTTLDGGQHWFECSVTLRKELL